MAKGASRKLKVFQAQFGFHDSVVAAPSKAAALRAWGTHQDLFAARQAEVATDAKAISAAMAEPGAPLRRAVGSSDPFEREPTGLPKIPQASRKAAPKSAARSTTKPERPVDRTRLDRAEAALARLDDDRRREEAEFRRREARLDAEKAEGQAAYARARKSADAAVADARAAYQKAARTAEAR